MPPPRWRWGLQYVPFGWVPRKHPWGAAPRCPACPAGVPISPEKWGERGPGASPLDPRFLWPLVPTRWVWGWLALVRSKGCCLRYAKTDLGRIFEKKYAQKEFFERKFPNQGTYLGPETAQRPFRCAPTLKAFPLGGRWAGKAGSDEGAILYPTFPCRRRDLSPRRLSSPAPLGNPVAPSSAPVCALGHLPPKGKALDCASLPVYETTSPSPPSRWAGRYERWFMGRRPVSEHRKNLPLATNQREVGPGRREPLSALVFFPPAFFQRKPGSRPGPGVLRGAAPRGNFGGTHP